MLEQRKIDMKGRDKIRTVLRYSSRSSWIIRSRFPDSDITWDFLVLIQEEHVVEVTFSLWHIVSHRDGNNTEDFFIYVTKGLLLEEKV